MERERSHLRWFGLSAMAVALLMVPVAVVGQSSTKPPIARFTERDDGRVVRLPVGAELTVRLPEQGGTAYRWVLRDSNAIRQTGAATTQNAAPPGIVGGTRLRTFRLQIVAGGRVHLRFQRRSTIPGDRDAVSRRFDLTVDADTMPYIPTDYGSDDRRLISVNEHDAETLVSTRLGDPIEVHLSASPSTGYHWEVLSSRNIAFERPIGVEYKPGISGFGAGPETIVRLHTTVDRSDGFLELVYMPPGERPDPNRAVRQLSYQFHNR